MISFCGTGMTDEQACKKALRAAVEISDLAYSLTIKYNFPTISVRIGIDFGSIKVERVGVRGKTQIIIIGSPATTAKRLETIGKSMQFVKNSTICIGYDIYYNLDEKDKKMCEKIDPSKELVEFLRISQDISKVTLLIH